MVTMERSGIRTDWNEAPMTRSTSVHVMPTINGKRSNTALMMSMESCGVARELVARVQPESHHVQPQAQQERFRYPWRPGIFGWKHAWQTATGAPPFP